MVKMHTEDLDQPLPPQPQHETCANVSMYLRGLEAMLSHTRRRVFAKFDGFDAGCAHQLVVHMFRCFTLQVLLLPVRCS